MYPLMLFPLYFYRAWALGEGNPYKKALHSISLDWWAVYIRTKGKAAVIFCPLYFYNRASESRSIFWAV
jgi:hypothetical protein